MNLPKLNSEQIKKLGLSTMGLVFLLYAYFTFFLGPLNKSRRAAEASIADLQQKIDNSKGELQKTSNLERQAKDAMARFAAFKALSPEGAPIAWFPPRVKSFFADRNIDKSVARLETSSSFKEAELAGWMKYNWSIDLPQSDYISAGQAIADLENAEPLLSINKLSIHGVVDQPQFQQVAIAATTVVEKR
jgi:cbb3-type cytochrome oxidase subunit 3